jgi:hypothetical protein
MAWNLDRPLNLTSHKFNLSRFSYRLNNGKKDDKESLSAQEVSEAI